MYSLNFSDEVGALVFDFGSMTTRVGFAGEDCPKVRINFLFGFKDQLDLKLEGICC